MVGSPGGTDITAQSGLRKRKRRRSLGCPCRKLVAADNAGRVLRGLRGASSRSIGSPWSDARRFLRADRNDGSDLRTPARAPPPDASTCRWTGCGALCAALGHPQHRLPPVIHVAGTNGKGSTVAFLRAIAEAAGLKVHAYHLAASGPLRRAHPPGRRADQRRAARRPHSTGSRRPTPASRSASSRSPPPPAFQAFAETPADLCHRRGRPGRPLRRHQRLRRARRSA